MKKSRVLLTTAIPYVNGNPHIGHALGYVQTDVLARSLRASGHEVLFTAGSDENALKNVESAEKAGKSVQEFVDEKVSVFQRLLSEYQITSDIYIRTSSPAHALGCQKLWSLSAKDIYKKSYTGLYCVGCETFYEDGAFPDNICPDHNRKLEIVEEENYFFALSKYQTFLEDLLESGKLTIYPSYRRDELLNFVKKGLQDFSISRPATRVKGWGIPVPGDDSQRMYVWYDALTNYITALGYGSEDESRYKSYWEASDIRCHSIGKDIIKFHGIYWPAMLQSAGLPLPTHLFTNGFITSNGQKMSKTLGNVVDPFALVKDHGIAATRYYLSREIPPHDDGDYSETRMTQLYTADLANELGNLISRTCAIAAKDGIEVASAQSPSHPELVSGSSLGSHPNTTANLHTDVLHTPNLHTDTLHTTLLNSYVLPEFDYQARLVTLWEQIKTINKSFNEYEPWAKSADERKEFMVDVLAQLNTIGSELIPYMPEIGETIQKVTSGKIAKISPLFPRG
ncbi:MAG: methionine--tRNA ligase [bacterium]